MARLRLQGIEKSYGSVQAVRGIDLDVAEGEFAVLVGPSGCGKSTLLRCIAGLEEVDAGTVTIGDDVVNDVRPRDRNLAMVFQNYALYPYMNVRENIAFGLKARRTPAAEIETRVRRAADMLGIEALLDRLPRQLSGGSASGWRSGGPSCATRGCSCSTSRSRTSTPSSATRCAPRSSACTRSSARP